MDNNLSKTINKLMTARKKELLRHHSAYIRGHRIAAGMRAIGLGAGTLGFCVLGGEAIAYLNNADTYTTSMTIASVINALHLQLPTDDASSIGSLVKEIADLPIGLSCIGCGMLLFVFGSFLLDVTNGRFYSSGR